MNIFISLERHGFSVFYSPSSVLDIIIAKLFLLTSHYLIHSWDLAWKESTRSLNAIRLEKFVRKPLTQFADFFDGMVDVDECYFLSRHNAVSFHQNLQDIIVKDEASLLSCSFRLWIAWTAVEQISFTHFPLPRWLYYRIWSFFTSFINLKRFGKICHYLLLKQVYVIILSCPPPTFSQLKNPH